MLKSTRCHQKRKVLKNTLWQNVHKETAQVLFDRINYTQNPQSGALEILEESHYYPFGLQHSNYNTDITKIDRDEELNNEKSLLDTAPPTFAFENRGYQYKFQGQEHQSEFGLNWNSFKWRNYSADLGRFWVIDPLAEVYEYNSPYAFQENKIGLGSEFEGSEIRLHDWLVREGITAAAKEVEKRMENVKMNDEEKFVARKHLYDMYKLQKGDTKGKAVNITINSGLSGVHNGDGDAFRHALFNAMNTQLVGDNLTRELGLAHENGDPNQPENEKIMDILNNEAGIEIGKKKPRCFSF